MDIVTNLSTRKEIRMYQLDLDEAIDMWIRSKMPDLFEDEEDGDYYYIKSSPRLGNSDIVKLERVLHREEE